MAQAIASLPGIHRPRSGDMMDANSAHDTARILIEALPYIQRFTGTTVVIK